MNPQMKQEILRRVLPKVKLKDLDWKWLILLVVMMFITLGDDFVLPVVGTFFDFIELPIDVIIAMILSRNTIRRAVEREGVTVQGRVVDEGAASSQTTQLDNRLG